MLAAGTTALTPPTDWPAYSDIASIAPVEPSVGGIEPKRGTGSRIPPSTTSPARLAPQGLGVAERRDQHTLRGLDRVADAERSGEDGVVGARRDQRLLVEAVGGALGGGDEPCADARRGGAGGQHGGDAACATDPAGGDDGHGDRVEDRVEQRQQPELTVRVAPGLDSLDDDQIAPGCLGRPCLLAVGDLPRGERATGVDRRRRSPGRARR